MCIRDRRLLLRQTAGDDDCGGRAVRGRRAIARGLPAPQCALAAADRAAASGDIACNRAGGGRTDRDPEWLDHLGRPGVAAASKPARAEAGDACLLYTSDAADD